MKRITKREAFARFCDGKSAIKVCPCKCHPYPPFSMAATVFGQEYLEAAARYVENPKLWKGTLEKTAWDLMYTNWQYYNASYETGYYAHYYIES